MSATKILKSVAVISYVAGTIWLVRWFLKSTDFNLIWFGGFIGVILTCAWAFDLQDAKKARRQRER